MIIEFTESEAQAIEYLIMGVGEPEDEPALRTAQNKLANAIEERKAA